MSDCEGCFSCDFDCCDCDDDAGCDDDSGCDLCCLCIDVAEERNVDKEKKKKREGEGNADVVTSQPTSSQNG